MTLSGGVTPCGATCLRYSVTLPISPIFRVRGVPLLTDRRLTDKDKQTIGAMLEVCRGQGSIGKACCPYSARSESLLCWHGLNTYSHQEALRTYSGSSKHTHHHHHIHIHTHTHTYTHTHTHTQTTPK